MNESRQQHRAAIHRRRLLMGMTVGYIGLVAVATMGPTWIVSGGLELLQQVVGVLLPGAAADRSTLELAANVVMFVPLGTLLLLLAGVRRWWLVLLVVLGLTATIELAQAGMPSRVSDLRDVAANSAGGVLGMLFGLLVSVPRRRVTLAVTAAALALGAVVLMSVGGVMVGRPALAVTENVTENVKSQLAYVRAHWSDRNAEEYGSFAATDCVNFASQSLIARGWEQTAEWWHRRSPDESHSYSDAWISSTALRDYLATRGDLATPLDASARDRVEPGDLVQFDWDSNGTPDHTGIVVSVADEGAGAVIRYASHSNDRERQGVDEAIERDGRGGSYAFWHLAG